MGYLSKNNKKIASLIILSFILVFIVGGVGGVFMNKYIFPRLSTSSFFGKIAFFKDSSEDVIIINKTEQVIVKEDDSVNQIASRAATSVVNILSIGSNLKYISNKKSLNGTGIIATGDGIIVTYRNAIIEENSKYIVLLNNREEYEAELIGIDKFTNLAYLKINATNLPSIEFANSNDFKPGKKLVSIGNSFNEYQNRFSAGLLSHIDNTFNLSGKSVAFSDKLEGVFETDFNNQQFYLGGPVISYGGALVGIIGKVPIDNSDFYFQIPSNVVKESLDRVLNNELDLRPKLGLYYTTITKEYSLINNLKKDRGAYINLSTQLAFIDGSSSQKSGLKYGDIIIAVNQQDVNISNPLSNLINKYKKGDEIELSVFRNDKDITINIKL